MAVPERMYIPLGPESFQPSNLFDRKGVVTVKTKGVLVNNMLLSSYFVNMSKVIESNALCIRKVIELVPFNKVQSNLSLYAPIITYLKAISQAERRLNSAAHRQHWVNTHSHSQFIEMLACLQRLIGLMSDAIKNASQRTQIGAVSISLVLEAQRMLKFIEHYNKEILNLASPSKAK